MRHECTKMIKVLITPEMIKEAEMRSAEMGELRNSITRGEGNLVGFIGELVAQKVLGGMIDHSYDHDLLMDDFLTTVDVKTKKTSVAPKESYACSVAAFNTKQQCDFYCFVRVKDDLKVGWYLGLYKKEAYFKDALRLAKGDFDPDNNYTVKADCYNLPISSLIQDLGLLPSHV